MLRVHSVRRFASGSAATKKKRGIILPLAGVAVAVGGGYSAAALYAHYDQNFKKVWIDNEQFTGGQRGIDLVVSAKEKAAAFDPVAAQKQISDSIASASETVQSTTADALAAAAAAKEKADAAAAEALRIASVAKDSAEKNLAEAQRVYESTKNTVTSAYDTTVNTVSKAQKSITDTANAAFETIESIKTSIFGASPSSPSPPPIEPPVAAPVVVKKEEPKKKPVEPKTSSKEGKKSASSESVKPVVVEEKPQEEAAAESVTDIDDTPIDFTPDNHQKPALVAKKAATPEPPAFADALKEEQVSPKKKEKKDKKREKKDTTTSEPIETGPAATDLLAAAASAAPIPATLTSSLSLLAASLDAIKPTPKNAAALKDAKESLAALLSDIPATSHQDLERQLEAQADALTSALVAQNEAALAALSDQERELAAAFEDALRSREEAHLESREQALRSLREQHAAEVDSRVQTAVAEEAEAIRSEWQVKVRQLVDAERDARLARLDHLGLKLKHLETICVNNSDYVLRMRKVQDLLGALRGVQDKVAGGGAFGKEFSVLKEVAGGDEVLEVVLSGVAEDVLERGISSVDELRQDFETLSTKLRRVQLMPEDGGYIAYAVSHALSLLMLQKHGLVAGTDTESIVSRAKFFMTHGDLESAAREVNQIKGWGKVLATDWLREARAHLEVAQALDAVETHVALKNFGTV